MAKVNLVGVERENLLLGEAPLDLDGQHHLLDLAPEAAIGREKQVARQLHGQRRGALGAALLQDVSQGSAKHPPNVHTPVTFKILVFGGNQGVAQHLGKIVVGVNDAPLQRELADDAVLVIVELGDGAGAVVLQFGDLRKV